MTAEPQFAATGSPTVTVAQNYIADSYFAQPADSLIYADATAGSFTVTLPIAAGHAGRLLRVKQTTTPNTVTVAAASGQTVDGLSSVSLANGAAVQLISDGAAWWVIASAGTVTG